MSASAGSIIQSHILLPTWQDMFIEKYAETMNIRSSAYYAGISRQTYYRYYESDPAFKERVDDAKQDALDRLEQAVIERARDGVKQITPIYYKGKKIDEVVRLEFSDALAKFVLESHRPETYRSKQTIEHTGNIGIENESAQEQFKQLATRAIQNYLDVGYTLELAIKTALSLGVPQDYIALVEHGDLKFLESGPVIDITPQANGGSNGDNGSNGSNGSSGPNGSNGYHD